MKWEPRRDRGQQGEQSHLKAKILRQGHMYSEWMLPPLNQRHKDIFGEYLDKWGHERFINVVEVLEFVKVNFVCSLTTKQGKNGSLFGQNSGKKCGFLLWN